MEENEEGMLPEDGILLTYIFKQSQKDVEIKAVDSQKKPETKTADSIVNIPIPGDSHEISKNLRKSHETKKLVEDIAVILSTSQPVMKNKRDLGGGANGKPTGNDDHG